MSVPPQVSSSPPSGDGSDSHTLDRRIGLVQATSLNVANMVGVGPFITIPLFIASMQGPQAMIGWVVAAVLVLCDGLVWAELGAALPGSGGTYHFLQEIYGRYRGGRLLVFLFIWQFLISGTLELASGYIGASNYLGYAFEGLKDSWGGWALSIIAAGSALAISISLCRHIASLAWLAVVLCAGAMLTVLIVIVSGLLHFDASLIEFPPDAFKLDKAFATGLGGAMVIAIYDYLGYYNVCHMGDEVIHPERNIPRAVIISVLIVAGIYMTMNIAILGVVPWQYAMKSENIAAEFMERLYGRHIAVGFTFFIIWTALASTFVMTLGYSRILYAAARNGDFFRIFGRLNPRGRFPTVALLSLGTLTALFCFRPLDEVINTAVIVRIIIQFLGQIFGLHLLRNTRPDVPLPFRMWLYPLPSIVAAVGWIFILVVKNEYLAPALAVVLSGMLVYPLWRYVVAQRPATAAD